MQVVEDMEEDILRLLLTGKVMHVVHNNNVHSLVEIHEVIDRIVL